MLLKHAFGASVSLALVLFAAGCGVVVDGDSRRAARAKHLSSDPRTHPSLREQREARAFVKAEADLMNSGDGFVTYRYDGSADLPHKVEFVPQKGALTIDFVASENLNRVDDVPHALLLVVYHMSHTAVFDELARTGEGIRRLLEAEKFSDAVRSVEKHYVQPGASGTLRLNRPDDGKYIGIVAGYATPNASACTFTTEYGLAQWFKKGDFVIARRRMMFSPLPTHLDMWLEEGDMVVKNTGPAHDSLRGLSTLMARQVRDLTWEESPLNKMTNSF